MERFVFVAAIAIAILAGLNATFGGNYLRFDFDAIDGGPPAAIVQTAPGSMQAQAFQGETLDLRHLAAVVTITPEERNDYLIEVDNQAGRAPLPTVSVNNGRVIVDGRLRGRVSRCLDDGGADLNGYGELTVADLPRINIRAPRTLEIERGGAGTTAVGASQSVDFDLSGCSTATLADVEAVLSVDLAGSGEIRAGAARGLDASVAGSGTLNTGAVSGGASVEIAGSGEVTLASLTGDLDSESAGSGELTILAGQVGDASLELAGSGGARIAAPVATLSVEIAGSADVIVEGVVGTLDAEVAGSGDITVQAVTGGVQQEVWGSGEVHILSRTPPPPAPAAPDAPTAPAPPSAPAAPPQNAP